MKLNIYVNASVTSGAAIGARRKRGREITTHKWYLNSTLTSLLRCMRLVLATSIFEYQTLLTRRRN